MERFSKYLLVMLGFMVAGMIGAAFATGTAQAVVATLVQIVNTNSSPVPTYLEPSHSPAANRVLLTCNSGTNAYASNSFEETTDGVTYTAYVVPTGMSLVIDSISGSEQATGGTGFASTLHIPNVIVNYLTNNGQGTFQPPLTLLQSFTDLANHPPGTTTYFYVFAAQYTAYANAGTGVNCALFQDNTITPGIIVSYSISLNGHLQAIQ